MVFPFNMLILFIVCAVLCAIGFYKFVWFLSVGYGFAIAGAGITLIVLYHSTISTAVILQCVLFVIYGIRLGGFLLVRELKSTAYRQNVYNETGADKKIPLFVSIVIWISVTVLYVAEVSPVFYRLVNGKTADLSTYVGIVIMILAIMIETIADAQKSKAKQKAPNRFCDYGLYKIVRCPNYFGELLFWTGVFVSGITAYDTALQWIIPVLGYLSIIYVMLSGAKRLEERQNKNYNSDPSYVAYRTSTPLLLPLIPLYSLSKCNWIKT